MNMATLLNHFLDRIEVIASLAAILGVTVSFYYHYRAAKLRRVTHSYFIAIKIIDVLNQSYLSESNKQRYLLNEGVKNIEFEISTITQIIVHFIKLFETIDDVGICESLELKRLTIKMKLSLFIQSIDPQTFKTLVADKKYALCFKNILLFTFCENINDIKNIDQLSANHVIDDTLAHDLEAATGWDKAAFRSVLTMA